MSIFTDTSTLTRLALRRDRIQLSVWLGGLVLLQVVTVESMAGLYGNESERIGFAKTLVNSPVETIFRGIVSGTSLGAMAMKQSLLLTLIGAAVMSTLATIRHTRQNEETGRTELIAAGVVGRYASLTAALLAVGIANIALGAVNAVALIATGLPAAGCFSAGAAIAAVGIVFAGIAAVTAQVTESARGANGLATVTLGLAFGLRALGDVMGKATENDTHTVSGWISWLSPLGWGQQMRPFDQNNWEVLAIAMTAFVGLTALAFVLTAHRDVGTGMLPSRPGPPAASRSLSNPLGLAWRLQRGVLISWAIGMTILGAAYGAIGQQVNDLIGKSDQTARLVKDLGGGGSDLTYAYFAAMLGILGLATAGYVIQTLLRMRSEEADGALELVLATATSRSRWALSHITIAVLGAVAILALNGLTTGFTYGLIVGDLGKQLGTLIGAALVQAPAVLLLAGIVVAVFGALPRLAIPLSWAALTSCLVLGQIGRLLKFPQLMLDISPFSHVPHAPAEAVTAVPMSALLGLAVLFTATGLALFRRRDLALS